MQILCLTLCKSHEISCPEEVVSYKTQWNERETFMESIVVGAFLFPYGN